MPIPENAKAIWNYLTSHGFSSNAAAGIEGNIEQESGGNPRAGGNPPGSGLIQELGDPGGTLEQELPKIIAYIQRNGSISDVNAHATSAQSAALYFSTRYERPLASAANNPNREQSAADVLAAAKSGNWPAGSASNASGSSGNTQTTGIIPNPFSSFGNWITGALGVSNIKDLAERGGLIIFGAALILLGLHMLGSNVFSSQNSSGAVSTPSREENSSGGSSEHTEKRSVAKGETSHVKTIEKSGAGKAATEAVEAAAVAL